MFLVCNGGAVRTDVDWPRCAIIVPCDDGDFLEMASIKPQSKKYSNQQNCKKQWPLHTMLYMHQLKQSLTRSSIFNLKTIVP